MAKQRLFKTLTGFGVRRGSFQGISRSVSMPDRHGINNRKNIKWRRKTHGQGALQRLLAYQFYVKCGWFKRELVRAPEPMDHSELLAMYD